MLAWLFSSHGVRDYIARRREFRQVAARFREAQKRLAEKQVRLTRAQKDDSFLELEARRHLGLVRSDEIEFRFLPSTSTADPEERLYRNPEESR